MSFLYDCISVLGPDQIISDIHAQELESVDSLHRHLIDEDGLMDPQLSLP